MIDWGIQSNHLQVNGFCAVTCVPLWSLMNYWFSCVPNLYIGFIDDVISSSWITLAHSTLFCDDPSLHDLPNLTLMSHIFESVFRAFIRTCSGLLVYTAIDSYMKFFFTNISVTVFLPNNLLGFLPFFLTILEFPRDEYLRQLTFS